MFCAFQPKFQRDDSGRRKRKFRSVKFALISTRRGRCIYVCMYMYVCLYACDEYMHVSLCINQCL